MAVWGSVAECGGKYLPCANNRCASKNLPGFSMRSSNLSKPVFTNTESRDAELSHDAAGVANTAESFERHASRHDARSFSASIISPVVPFSETAIGETDGREPWSTTPYAPGIAGTRMGTKQVVGANELGCSTGGGRVRSEVHWTRRALFAESDAFFCLDSRNEKNHKATTHLNHFDAAVGAALEKQNTIQEELTAARAQPLRRCTTS